MDTVITVIAVVTVLWLLLVGIVLLMYPKRRARARSRYTATEDLLARGRAEAAGLEEETRPDKEV